MTITVPAIADYAEEILRVAGDPNTTLAPLLTAPTYILWNLWNERGPLSLELQYQYALRAALDIRLKEEQNDTDFTTESGLQDKQSARFDHLQTMRDNCQAEILVVESRLRANRVAVIGAITTTTPESPCWPNSPDPNADRLRGSAFHRDRRPW